MKPKRSARCFMIQWKIAVAPNGCAISEKSLAMTSSKSLMDAPTRMKRQSHRGWNENALTSKISRTRMVRHGWYQRRISCITPEPFWRSFDDMVSKYSNGSVEERTAPFGITELL